MSPASPDDVSHSAAALPWVTLHLWTVRRRDVPAALAAMGTDRLLLRRTPGVRFAKMLGTGDGRTFTARDATPTRWGALVCWDDEQSAAQAETRGALARWRARSSEQLLLSLRPLTSRGRWSGAEPFGDPVPRRTDGPVAAVTRARLAPRKALTFWRAVPPVSADLHRSPGLRAAVGIGEAPVGLQGTLSLWESATALRDFAHRGAAHQQAIARTATEAWYAEELFARFAVVDSIGTLDGLDPLAGLR